MADLEDRLRAAVARRCDDFDPCPGLPDRIVARVEHRRRVRRVMAGAAAAAAAASVVVTITVVAGLAHDDQGSVRVTDGRAPATTAPDREPTKRLPSTTTTVAEIGPGTSAAGTAAPGAPGSITPLTPLSRHGIGPIRAGMTRRAAQEAAGATITPAPGGSSGDCVEAHIEGGDAAVVVVIGPPADPGADGVIRAVTGSVLPTEEGAIVGQSRDELLAALGQPTGTVDQSSGYGPGAEVLVFESGGFAYGALVVDDMVLGLQSGDPGWVGEPDGCPS